LIVQLRRGDPSEQEKSAAPMKGKERKRGRDRKRKRKEKADGI
jgi:hypothetical protein